MNDDLIFQKDSPSKWLVRLLKGIAVGIGAILPGLSGGVLSVIFNIYEPMVRFLGNIRKNFRTNVQYFIPIGLGGVIGVVLFSIFVERAFGRLAAQFTCLFIGFVAGTLPSLSRTAGKKGRNSMDWVILFVSAAVIYSTMVFGGAVTGQIAPSFAAWVFSGALVGLGIIVPGLSPSNFLIYLGLYDRMAGGIAALDLGVIIPLMIGAAGCVLVFAKGATWVFDRFYSKMYHLIIGTVIGSSLAIFPTVVFPAMTSEGLLASGLSFTASVLIAVVMFIAGAILSFGFSKLEMRVTEAVE